MGTVWLVLFGTLCVASLAAAAGGDGRADGANGPDGKKSLLVDSKGLQAELGRENLRVLDVRPSGVYSKGHIPDAINIDVAKWKQLEFDDSQGWAAKVSSLGIKADTHVIVYGSKLSNVARAWWLLTYAGVKEVSILDGGYDWWSKRDGPTATVTPNIVPTDFKPDFQSDRLEEMGPLRESMDASTINVLDTRSAEEFNAGRIPGATHLEWKELVTADGRFKSKSQLQKLFKYRGIAPSHAAVCY